MYLSCFEEMDKGREGKHMSLILFRGDGQGSSRQIHVLNFASKRRTRVVKANTCT